MKPIILLPIGFRATPANLLTVPVYVVACIATCAVAYYVDRHGHRGECVLPPPLSLYRRADAGAATQLWQYTGRALDSYGKQDAAEAAASTASRIAQQSAVSTTSEDVNP